MSINVSQLSNNLNKKTLENYEEAGSKVASNFSKAEDVLMQAYTAKDVSALAEQFGCANDAATVQQIAQLKYEKASRIFSMFSKIMENAHQMLMQIINKIG